MEMKKYILFLCIERFFGLISGSMSLEFFFVDCRSNTIILGEVRNTKKVGERLKEKED
jgi:hypothetical protein